MAKLYSENWEGFRYGLIEGYWHRETGGWLNRSRSFSVIGLGSIFGFLLLWEIELDMGTKIREARIKVLTIWVQLLQSF